ncbi:xap5,circadian timekeeper [Hordeum vulgare]|nr:xap5,circadian timekeeper [Hordeum vulgare]
MCLCYVHVKSRKTATDETRSSKGEDVAAGRVSELAQESRLPFFVAYWDGTGHVRAIQVRKGDSIGEFLRANHQQLAPEFHQQHSLYELIINKARGKSEPVMLVPSLLPAVPNNCSKNLSVHMPEVTATC